MLAAAAVGFAQSDSAEAIPLQGDPYPARVVRVNPADVTLKIGDEEKKIPTAELFKWGRIVENRRESQIMFAGGGQLTARFVRIEDEMLHVASAFFGDLKIPIRTVQGVLYKPPWKSQKYDALFTQIEKYDHEADRVELLGGDSLAGALLDFIAADPYDDEVVGKVRIRLPDSGEVIEGTDERIRAILFNSALTRRPSSFKGMVWLGWSDGTLLPVRNIAQANGLAHITLASGLTMATDEFTFYEELAFFRPVNEQVVWLNELPPLAYKHTPWLKIAWPMHLNRNAAGGRLRSKNALYDHGVGMHSRSRVAFKTQGAKRFEASVAVDRAAGDKGSVEFRIYKNIDGGWSPAWQSGVIRGGEDPQRVSLDVSDAAAILLIVDFADQGDILDYANWLDARFIQ